jgi:hypothetical protein
VAITKTDVLLIAPELSGVADDTWDALIADAALQMNVDVWGTRYNLGAKYLVAHLATLTTRRGSPLVSSQTVGPVSVSYAVGTPTDGGSDLESTPYGREYRRLARALAPRMAVL